MILNTSFSGANIFATDLEKVFKILGTKLPNRVGLTFVSWHQTPVSLSGGLALNQTLVYLYYSI